MGKGEEKGGSATALNRMVPVHSVSVPVTPKGRGAGLVCRPARCPGLQASDCCNKGSSQRARSVPPLLCRAAATAPVQERPAPPEQRAPELASPEPAGASRPFDWAHQWYPVAVCDDLEAGRPARVWLFDDPIAVVRRQGQPPLAMLDRCPHRLAALSEGRMTAAGDLQCAYHGWSFNAKGECTSIPQDGGGNSNTARTCATALPALEHQGLLWLCPTPGQAPPLSSLSGIEELDMPGWTCNDFVRDFPVDYTLLLENLMDPDHGLFAHQSNTFDTYAGSRQYPMSVSTAAGRTGSRITGQVQGTSKLTGSSEEAKKRALPTEKGSGDTIQARIAFEAPCFVRWSRHDEADKCSFIAAFYAIPAGFGRTRFISRYCRNLVPWLPVPRWLFGIALNAFVDQDTFLLATQQPATLSAELDAARQHGLLEPGAQVPTASSGSAGSPIGMQRGRMFCHRSPTDSLLVTLGRWLDCSVPHMPNRYRLAQAAGPAGMQSVLSPPREAALDRWAGHTAICPASMQAFKQATDLRNILAVSALVEVASILAQPSGSGLLSASTAKSALLLGALLGGCLFMQSFRSQFQYVHTPDRQWKQLAKISSVFPDLTPSDLSRQ